VNIDNGEYQKLTFTSEAESSPAWSPDGKQIAFVRLLVTEGSGAYVTWALMVMNANGSNVRLVTDFPVGPGRVSWSPDGQKIVFTSSGQCGEIYSVGIDGNNLMKLTDLPGCARNPAWSPDGRYIVFESSQNENITDLWRMNIMNADGGVIKDVYGGPIGRAGFRPEWAPTPSLIIGESYVITDAGMNLNLRREASITSSTLRTLKTGDVVTVLKGPIDTDDYYWWKLLTEDGTIGWAVEMFGWYQPVSP